MDAARPQRLPVGRVDMDAVGGDRPPVKHPQRVEILHGGHPGALPHRPHLGLGLRHVDRERQIVAAAEVAAAKQVFARHGVGGMGPRTGPHAVGRQGEQRLQIPFEHGHIGVQTAGAEQRPNAQPVGDRSDAVLVPVHVHERGGTAQQHLDDAQLGTQRHVVARLERFEGPDIVVEPLHEGDIVGIAALKGHRHVAVGVHQAGHQHLAAAIPLAQAGRSGPVGLGLLGPVGRQHDAVALDGDPAREGFAGIVPRCGHRNDGSMGKKQFHIGFIGRGSSPVWL